MEDYQLHLYKDIKQKDQMKTTNKRTIQEMFSDEERVSRTVDDALKSFNHVNNQYHELDPDWDNIELETLWSELETILNELYDLDRNRWYTFTEKLLDKSDIDVSLKGIIENYKWDFASDN